MVTLVDVTAAVLSAGASPYLRSVVDGIRGGTVRPARIEVVWSGLGPPPGYLDEGVSITVIPPRSFDHGRTRQAVLERAETSVVSFLSDDAVPIAPTWLERLLAPFASDEVGVVYGRQVGRPEHGVAERVFRATRYPKECSVVGPARRSGSILFLPVSDANVAYRVAALKSAGGFPVPCAFGEDQVAFERIVAGGWSAAYAGDAAVWHSHRLSWSSVIARGWQSAHAEGASAGSRVRRTASLAPGLRFVARMVKDAFREAGLLGMCATGGVSTLRAVGYLAGLCYREVSGLDAKTRRRHRVVRDLTHTPGRDGGCGPRL